MKGAAWRRGIKNVGNWSSIASNVVSSVRIIALLGSDTPVDRSLFGRSAGICSRFGRLVTASRPNSELQMRRLR
jgi:hypothetical protein